MQIKGCGQGARDAIRHQTGLLAVHGYASRRPKPALATSEADPSASHPALSSSDDSMPEVAVLNLWDLLPCTPALPLKSLLKKLIDGFVAGCWLQVRRVAATFSNQGPGYSLSPGRCDKNKQQNCFFGVSLLAYLFGRAASMGQAALQWLPPH